MSGVGERYHALDAVRGGVLVLGVFFHATLSFLPGEQMWLVMDSSRSAELSVLFFTLHIFRMTVFFVLAGFFGRLLLERVGVGGFDELRQGSPYRWRCSGRLCWGVYCRADLGRCQLMAACARRAAAAADG
jgi:hypothetical protein